MATAADQPRPDRASTRSRSIARSLTARLGAGSARTRGRGRARRTGTYPGHFPQSFRVRDDRRLRRNPLRRAGLQRLRALRRARHLDPPACPRPASFERSTPLTRPPGRLCGSSCSARRAPSGVIPDVTVRVRPIPPVRRYEGWIAESFEAGWRSSARWRRGTGAAPT